eukprot:IDg4737t1
MVHVRLPKPALETKPDVEHGMSDNDSSWLASHKKLRRQHNAAANLAAATVYLARRRAAEEASAKEAAERKAFEKEASKREAVAENNAELEACALNAITSHTPTVPTIHGFALSDELVEKRLEQFLHSPTSTDQGSPTAHTPAPELKKHGKREKHWRRVPDAAANLKAANALIARGKDLAVALRAANTACTSSVQFDGVTGDRKEQLGWHDSIALYQQRIEGVYKWLQDSEALRMPVIYKDTLSKSLTSSSKEQHEISGSSSEAEKRKQEGRCASPEAPSNTQHATQRIRSSFKAARKCVGSRAMPQEHESRRRRSTSMGVRMKMRNL